jgi:hypothetical protein
MSDTFTSNLKIRQPQTDAYSNTWGSVLNSDALQLFDTAIAGLSAISIGSSTAYAMPAMSQGSDSPSRYFCIQFSGTPSAAVTVTLPSTVTSKFYLVDNANTGQTLTFTYAGSTHTVTVAVGEKRLIWCDGTNVWDIDTAAATTLGGLTSANFARLARTAAEIAANTTVQNVYAVTTPGIAGGSVTNVYPTVTLTLPVGSTITLDPTMGETQQVTLTGNYTIGVPANTQDGSGFTLYVIQDGTGGRTLSWNSVFLFAGGATPTLSTIGGAIDKFTFRYNGNLAKWLVSASLNITSPSGATYPLTISQNVMNWKLAPLLGTLGGPITVTVTVNQGVIVDSLDPADPAMDLSGLPSGSTVNLVNLGYITGAGGDGGYGANASYPGSGETTEHATAGLAGGNAIVGPGLSRTFNVTNANGHIWGGGGGGGGSGAFSGNPSNGAGSGGGGGGGAGGGRGGVGGRAVYIGGTSAPASSGTQGSRGPNRAAGTAGTGTSYGAGQIGTAGAGGDYGAAGSAGTNPSTTTTGHFGAFGAGGAAGKAIELSGASAPTVGGDVKGIIS